MSPDRVNNGLAPLRNERNACLPMLAYVWRERREKQRKWITYKLITITKRQAGNPQLR